MTTQIPDRLVNRFSAIELGELDLYQVLTGELLAYDGSGVRYPWQNKPVIPEKRSASLNRGYVATIVLHEDARLELTRFSYPFVTPPMAAIEISEFLEGNGWLRMSPHDAWPRVAIPFRDGRIVGDESQWVICDKVSLGDLRFPQRDWFDWVEPKHISLDDAMLAGRVSRSFQRRDVVGGTWVQLEAPLAAEHEWSRYQVRRGGKVIARVRTGAATGEPDGPWLLFGLNDLPVEAGDELWATDRR